MWAVQRLALRTKRWGPVITSQLASNAFGRVVPGGVAASGAMQYAMLTRAGHARRRAAASGMTASSVLVFATLCALPVLAVPAVLGGAPVDPGPGARGGDRRRSCSCSCSPWARPASSSTAR